MTSLVTPPVVAVRRSPTAVPAHSVRGDIQGLRAVAVLLVVSAHLTGWPSGGFIGVDVFFVISGFLITGLLLREHARTGRISFADFYRRRARRIIPVAVLVLVSTVVASYLIFFESRARETLHDALWSAVFAANARFALIGTDYQHAGDAVSPLQHFWSLSVEEQYYVVWPLLLVAILAVTARRARGTGSTSRGLAVLVVAVTAASLAWAFWETGSNPTTAYFSTASRAWELSIGAGLAVFSPQLGRLGTRSRTWCGWTGLSGIVASAFLIDADSAFPAPWALLPVLATAAVIAAGTGATTPRLAPLDNAPMAYVGDISYSLYLWHWPVIVLAASVLPAGPTSVGITVALLLSLSVLSYHFVEDPIRTSRWLEPRSRAHRGSRSREVYWSRSRQVIGVLVLCVVTTAMASYAVVREPVRPATASPAPPLSTVAPAGPTGAGQDGRVDAAQQRLDVAISGALASTSWPELTPSLDALDDHRVPEWVKDGCLGGERGAEDDPRDNASRCVYGSTDAPKTAALLGDSVAISYLPGIRAALEPHGWQIRVYTLAECPALTVTVVKSDRSAHPACDVFREWALNEITALSPDLTILSTAADSSGRFVEDGTALDTPARWRAGTDATLARLSETSTRTVVLSPPPANLSLQDCATRTGVPWDCVRKPSAEWSEIVRQEADAAAAHGPTVTAVDTKRWFCSVDNVCPSFIGTTPVRADGSHLTDVFSQQLGPVLETVLLAETSSS